MNTSAAELSEAQRQTLRRRLLEIEAELSREVAEHREELATPQSATENTFVAGSEGAREAADDDRAVAFLRHETQELAEAREALARLDAGRYGECAACGEPVGLARLEALPTARLCLACQSAAETHLRG